MFTARYRPGLPIDFLGGLRLEIVVLGLERFAMYSMKVLPITSTRYVAGCAAEHQAQSASNGLFRQNICLRRWPKTDYHRDALHVPSSRNISTLTMHSRIFFIIYFAANLAQSSVPF